jgi:hypothetical protein
MPASSLLVKLFDESPHAKVTVNINAALTELLDEHGMSDVLDGLREWLETTPQHTLRNDVLAAEKGALELLLEHRLYKSDKTGQVIHHNFTLLSYPHRWYYNVLRGWPTSPG